MAFNLVEFVGARSGEEKPVLLLLGKGFFMGVFLTVYQVVTRALFINNIGSYLQEAFFISGFLGVVTTIAFSFLQNRIAYTKLLAFNLSVILLFVSSITIFHTLLQGKYLIFVSFVMIGPITAVMVLGFSGLFGRIFDPRQSKRIIGSIDAGQLIATILVSFALPLVLGYFNEIINILWIGIASLIICLLFLLWIKNSFSIDISFSKLSEEDKSSAKFSNLFRNKYTFYLSFFLIFSMAAFQFVDYSFLKVAEMQYPDEAEITSFLFVFNGVIMVISLLIQTFVNNRIIGQYGLKTALLVMPVTLIVFTLLAIFIGFTYGYTTDTENFVWFFLFIATSKLLTTSIKDAMENPAFKLFFLPLNVNIRFDIQTKIEGVVNKFSEFISGILILLIGYYFNLIDYSIFLVFIILGIILMAGKLYHEYREMLKNTLARQKVVSPKSGRKNDVLKDLKKELATTIPDRKIFALTLLEKLEPYKFKNDLLVLVNDPNVEVKEFVLNKINYYRFPEAVKPVGILVNNEKDERILQLANLVLENINKASKVSLSDFQFFILTRSDNPHDRIYAALKIYNSDRNSINTSFLGDLIGDINPDVKAAAIIAAGKCGRPEFWSLLIENLKSSEFSNISKAALVEAGEKVLPILETAFYRTEEDVMVQVKLIQIIGKIGGRNAIELLWQKVDYPNERVVAEILLSLKNADYQAKGYHAVKIRNIIEEDIGDIAWNLASLEDLPDTEREKLLREALEEEISQSYEHIYMLLAMIYDPHSVQLVKENIETKTSDGVAYAIELLDVFLEEDLKIKLIPVLDDISNSERIGKLQLYYPRVNFHNEEKEFDRREILKDIINRDFNHLNRWTKACAIHALGQSDRYISQDIIASLYNPDSLLRQTAAHAIFSIDPSQYQGYTRRLEKIIKTELDNYILHGYNDHYNKVKKYLAFEKVLFLRSTRYFKNTPGIVLADLSDICQEYYYVSGEKITNSTEKLEDIIIVVSGYLIVREDKSIVSLIAEKEVVTEFSQWVRDEKYTIEAGDETLVFKINLDEYYNMMSYHHHLIINIFEMNKTKERRQFYDA